MAFDDLPPQDSFQPVQEISSTTVEYPSSTSPHQNGATTMSMSESFDVPLNGAPTSAEVKTELVTLPEVAASELVSTQETTTLTSSLPQASSFEPSMTSEAPVTTEVTTVTVTDPLDLADTTSDAPPPRSEQPPISDLRSPPQPDVTSSEATLRMRDEKHEEDSVATAASPTPLTVAQEITTTETVIESAAPPAMTDTDQTVPGLDVSPEMQADLETPPAESTMPTHSLPEPQLAPVALQGEASQEPAPVAFQAEAPQEPAPKPAIPSSTTDLQADHEMLDVQSPAAKVSRERDEDVDELEPAAKRTKTEPDSEAQDFKMPDIPPPVQSPAATNGESSSAAAAGPDDDKITPARLAHMKKIISNLKKGNTSQLFRAPVDYLALKLPTYPDTIKHPMDLGKIDQKLKNNEYTSIKQYTDDFDLIVSNSVTFNGPEHPVTQSAKKMENSFSNQMQHLPSTVPAPIAEEKKAPKLKEQPTRTAPPRRQSTTGPNASMAKSPSTASASQTFALNPEGVPQIRRDSTVTDGRPKRAIKPTRARDMGGVRPRKKKYEMELRFCQEALNEVIKPRHWTANQYFKAPVDPIALQIPTYFQIIKKPMDLETMGKKLENNEYEKAKDFEQDFHLIISNCIKFNGETGYVTDCAHALGKIFEEKWKTMGEWIAQHQPVSEPQSDEDEEDEHSEDDEEEDSDDERHEKIAQLQRQMEAMSKHMSELAKPKKDKKKSTPPTLPSKKSHKSKTGKKDKQPASFPALGKDSKKKSVSKVSKPEKERYVSYAEKQYISNGIGQLDERRMTEALHIIQSSVPSLSNSDQTEIELDIDELPNYVLLKLLTFLKKHAPAQAPEPQSEPAYTSSAAAMPTKTKKNKPMSKDQQEQRIAEIQGKLDSMSGETGESGFSNSMAVGRIDNVPALASIEQDDSSGDEDDSEESEEE